MPKSTKGKRRRRGNKKRRRLPSLRLLLISILVVAVVVAAYYLNSPTPDGIRNPWQYRCFIGSKRVVTDAAYVVSVLTSTPYLKVLRFMLDVVVPISPPEVSGSNIRMTLTTFGGVPVRLYQPIRRTSSDGLGPAVIYAHGGAFAIGSAAMSDILTRRIAESLDCVVVSIDYRLAPEHPYPAALDDTAGAFRWFVDHAHEFGVDRARIGIAGDSAGGTIAAIVTHEIRDDPEYPDFAFHAVVYPLTQLLDIETPSALLSKHHFGRDGSIVTWYEAAKYCSYYLIGRSDERIENALVENRHISEEFHRSRAPQLQYVNHSKLPHRMRDYDFYTPPDPSTRFRQSDDRVWDEIKSMILNPRICPLMREDLGGLPPAFVATCEYDGIRDHGAFYALRLQEANVTVRWENYEEGFHGVLGPSWPLHFDVGEKMFQDLMTFARKYLQIDNGQ